MAAPGSSHPTRSSLSVFLKLGSLHPGSPGGSAAMASRHFPPHGPRGLLATASAAASTSALLLLVAVAALLSTTLLRPPALSRPPWAALSLSHGGHSAPLGGKAPAADILARTAAATAARSASGRRILGGPQLLQQTRSMGDARRQQTTEEREGGAAAGKPFFCATSPSLPPSHLCNLMGSSFFKPHPKLLAREARGPAAPTSQSARRPSGTCIAIASAPRAASASVATWATLDALLRALQDRRQKASLLGEDTWAVVLASGCPVSLPAGVDFSNGDALDAYVDRLVAGAGGRHSRDSVVALVAALERLHRTGLGRRAEEHWEGVQATAAHSEMDTTVVRVDGSVCRLMQDPAALLRLVDWEWVQADGWERWLWRAQLALDFVAVTQQCLASNPKRILLLQDDTTPAKQWDVGIEQFVRWDLRGREPWLVLSLYQPGSFFMGFQHAQEYGMPCCAQALLFNASLVPAMMRHFHSDWLRRPMDINIKEFLAASRMHAYVHVPSLFQHNVGVHTSGAPGNFHMDPNFNEDFVSMRLRAQQ